MSGLGRLGRSALWHAERGLAVFPLRPGTKVPVFKDEDWQQLATTDRAVITGWWSEVPYNIGLATGAAGLIVLDLDKPRTAEKAVPEQWASRGVTSGRDVLDALAFDVGQRLPKTWTVATPSGGQHLYFRQPARTPLGNSAGRLGWKVDTRGQGGYVVAAGSMVGGRRYRATVIRRPAPLPEWLTEALTPPPAPVPEPISLNARSNEAYGLAALTRHLDKLLASTEGRRNDDLNFAAYSLGQVVAIGALMPAVVRDELLSAAMRIGLARREAERTISNGMTAGIRKPHRQVS
ncbi:bifunctional DNA primase/polymerase [Kribbella sandramycini]|uniref:Bifunctional DNA primase/polymerase n=1 Tax=Kribbella sandramycini TaxID=60450 RepID=A0A7Y4L4Q6_9ACTN|nr:bifunctional DNA primase/polymerase [Kribbella sandramycini]MBB6571703.1 hypothetical protein [Kribbella sandramycini]NOL44348.1 bifunctional DNA primase/polymerase [Kribbella sandramycini]